MTVQLNERPADFVMPGAPSNEEFRELALVAQPTAVTCARLLVQSAFVSWQLDRSVLPAAEQIMNALTEHSVATSSLAYPSPRRRSPSSRHALISVQLRLRVHSIVLEVWDSSPAIPTKTSGLSDVASRGYDWGYHFPFQDRRVVWCVLPILAADDTAQFPAILPSRAKQVLPAPRTPVEPMRDQVLLQRVLDGLRALDQPTDQEK